MTFLHYVHKRRGMAFLSNFVELIQVSVCSCFQSYHYQ
uniref:Uncharacterized protein n=1 Tax=Arundo donax TaxID=35708 RepID=A0A0A8YUR4_ARUDO